MPGLPTFSSLSTSRWAPQPPSPPEPIQGPDIHIYVQREDGSFVPTIPVDELPLDIRLTGVPQQLTDTQTQGLHCAGMIYSTGRVFGYVSLANMQEAQETPPQYRSYHPTLRTPTEPRAHQARIDAFNPASPIPTEPRAHARVDTCYSSSPEPRAHRVRVDTFHPPSPVEPKIQARVGYSSVNIMETPPQHHSLHPDVRVPTEPKAHARADTNTLPQRSASGQVHHNNIKPQAATNQFSQSKDRDYYRERPLPPSGFEPDPSKKSLCSFWIQHGTCSYGEVGCRYKHVMPDLKRLKLLFGYTEYPNWWLSKLASERRANEKRLRKTLAARSKESPDKKGPPLNPSPTGGDVRLNKPPPGMRGSVPRASPPVGEVRLNKPSPAMKETTREFSPGPSGDAHERKTAAAAAAAAANDCDLIDFDDIEPSLKDSPAQKPSNEQMQQAPAPTSSAPSSQDEATEKQEGHSSDNTSDATDKKAPQTRRERARKGKKKAKGSTVGSRSGDE